MNLKIKVYIKFFGLMVVVVESFSTGLRSGDSVGCHNLFIVIFTLARVLMMHRSDFDVSLPSSTQVLPLICPPSVYEC